MPRPVEFVVGEQRPAAPERFDPIAEGERYRLSHDALFALWERARSESTARGERDGEWARHRFHALAAKLAPGRGFAVGKSTLVIAEELRSATGDEDAATAAPRRASASRGDLASPGRAGRRLDEMFAAPRGDSGLPFRDELEQQFGEVLDDVDVAVDSNLPRGALAAAGPGRIAFATAAPSKATVAHEVAHVLQYRRGAPSSSAALGSRGDPAELEAERAARDVAIGHSFRVQHRPTAHTHLQEAAAATALAISVNPGGQGATFTVTTDSGATLTASGTISADLKPGTYTVVAAGKGAMTIKTPSGKVVPSSAAFNIPATPRNAAAVAALAHAASAISMTVGASLVAPGGGSGSGAGGGGAGAASTDPDKDRFDAFPDHIRNFLTTTGAGPAIHASWAELARLAQKIADLTPEELDEYRARTLTTAATLAELEQSLDSWVAQVQQRRAAQNEQEAATQALYGLGTVYDQYRSWRLGLVMGGPPGWIADWERQPVDKLPKQRDGDMNQLYLSMRRSLAPFGFANLAAFEAAIERFVVAFRENAFLLASELLDRFEHALRDQQRAGGGPQMAALHTSLTPARKAYADAEQYKASVDAQYGSSWDPADVNASYAAGPKYQEMKAQASSQVAAHADGHPLLGAQDFPREQLATASQADIGGVMSGYVTSHLKKVADTRARLSGDHELVFKLDRLVAQAKAAQGVADDSVWDKVIKDHNAPSVDQIALEVMGAVLAIAVGLMSGGSLLAAGASVAYSAYTAVDQYQEYAAQSDAYGAQLLSTDPSIGWVVLAVVGAIGDMAAVSKFIRPIAPAIKEFQAGKLTVEQLGERMSGIEERVRKAILARAEVEHAAQQGWKSMLPQGALHASVFGLEHVAGPILYGVYINVRRGINTFNKWMLTREAAELVGDAAKLRPEEISKLRALFNQAIAETQKVANSGARMGMSPSEIDAAIQTWAKEGGTAEDVIAKMARREVVVDRATAAGAVTRSSIPRGHTGGVMVQGPGGTYIKLLPLDAQGRATGVVARIDGAMLTQATGAEASGKILGRAASQDRGHLLARILGGPDLTQNLAPLLKNINERDMRMVELEVRKAIQAGNEATITVAPIYTPGRLDPDAFLMSVRWKDGSVHEVSRFANPATPAP
jgi:hypothetical protein